MQALRFAKRFARQVNHVAFPFCLQGRRSELVLRRSIPGPPIPCLRFARRHRHQPRDCSERRRVRRLHLMGRERREARWPTAIQAEALCGALTSSDYVSDRGVARGSIDLIPPPLSVISKSRL